MLKKGGFNWTDRSTATSSTLTSASVLTLTDFFFVFTMKIDAYDVDIGTVPMQKGQAICLFKLAHFFSTPSYVCVWQRTASTNNGYEDLYGQHHPNPPCI